MNRVPTEPSQPVSIYFGIAGWSYDDWRGVVYPRRSRDKSTSDTLRFCAGFVDYIEINNTFYRFPVAEHCSSWVKRVADLPTRFTAKIPQEFTHGMCAVPRAVEACEGFAPLAESGRLTTLLAQFSYAFERSPRNLEHLAWLREEFCGVAPLTVEVRHRSWARDEAIADLRELGVGVANLDYPGEESGFGVRATGIHAGDGVAYFRLHGRNADAWFRKDAGRDEVYDYEYSGPEVQGISERSREIGRGAKTVVVIANNHFRGKAMKLVLELLSAYRKSRVPVPEPLIAAYPSLGEIAERQPGRLF